MIFVGLDPATSTGYVELSDDEIFSCEFHAKKFSDCSVPGVRRAANLASQIVDRWQDVQLLAIEGYGFSNKFTLVPLVEIGTVLRYFAMQKGVPLIEVAPTQLKKFACGKGNAKKDEIRLAVFKNWQQEFKSHNEVDAFVLAKIAEAICVEEKNQTLNTAQKSVVSALRNANAFLQF